MVPQRRLDQFNTWSFPRSVLCCLCLCSTSIILVAGVLFGLSKHMGSVLLSVGAVLMGLGLCTLLVCIAFIAHNTCVVKRTARPPPPPGDPRRHLGGGGPPQATRNAWHPAQRPGGAPNSFIPPPRYEMPPNFSVLNGRLTTDAGADGPSLQHAPFTHDDASSSGSGKNPVEKHVGGKPSVSWENPANVWENSNETRDKSDVVWENPKGCSGMEKPGDSGGSQLLQRTAFRLVDGPGGGVAYYRSVPSTIDEEDETLTVSATPSAANVSFPTPYSLHNPASPSGTTQPSSDRNFSSSGGKATGGIQPQGQARSIPITNPPPLPTPPKPDANGLPRIPSQGAAVGRDVGSPTRGARTPSPQKAFLLESSLAAHSTRQGENQSGLDEGMHGGGSGHHQPSNQYPTVIRRPQGARVTSPSGGEEGFRPVGAVRVTQLGGGGLPPDVRQNEGRGVAGKSKGRNLGRNDISSRGDVGDYKSATIRRNVTTSAGVGPYERDSRDRSFESTTGGESDFSPSVTLDWTASDESYPVSTTSEDSSPAGGGGGTRGSLTSPESVVMATRYATAGLRDRSVTSQSPPSGVSTQSVMTSRKDSFQNVPRKEALSSFQNVPRKGALNIAASQAPKLKAHRDALADSPSRGVASGGGASRGGASRGVASGSGALPGGVRTTVIPSGLMMRPFVDGTVTVTPLNGSVGGAYWRGGQGGAQRPPELEELSTNMTETSVDSKVTIYDNVNYMYM